jgi:hypothetical protein
LIAAGEPAFTKPEPVVLRAKERGSSTPRLGTVVTAQTLPGEESEHTVRAPDVAFEDSPRPVVVLAKAAQSQPLLDPEPSIMPDVVSAMVTLHAGVDADDAPTRLRDVVTSVRSPKPVAPVPEPVRVAVELTPEPQVVEDAWLTESSLANVVSAPVLLESEHADPALHEAVTWQPAPVAPVADGAAPTALVIASSAPELSPLAPAVLPNRSSEVSELLDSFYVSDAAEEHELRSALKEMAGLSLTPMPRSLTSER